MKHLLPGMAVRVCPDRGSGSVPFVVASSHVTDCTRRSGERAEPRGGRAAKFGPRSNHCAHSRTASAEHRARRRGTTKYIAPPASRRCWDGAAVGDEASPSRRMERSGRSTGSAFSKRALRLQYRSPATENLHSGGRFKTRTTAEKSGSTGSSHSSYRLGSSLSRGERQAPQVAAFPVSTLQTRAFLRKTRLSLVIKVRLWLSRPARASQGSNAGATASLRPTPRCAKGGRPWRTARKGARPPCVPPPLAAPILCAESFAELMSRLQGGGHNHCSA